MTLEIPRYPGMEAAATIAGALPPTGAQNAYRYPPIKVYINDDTNVGTGVTLSSAQSITSLHSHQPIIVSGGTLTLAQDSLIDSTFSLDGGTLNGAGNLAISGLFTWSSGTMSGAGFTTANGGINITSNNWKHLQRTLNNTSGNTATYFTAAVSFSIDAGGIFNNQAGATFNHQTDGALIGAAIFNNAGIFNRTTGTGTATISVPFTNTGTVSVNSGTLSFAGAYHTDRDRKFNCSGWWFIAYQQSA
jgi:hypothetical protein